MDSHLPTIPTRSRSITPPSRPPMSGFGSLMVGLSPSQCNLMLPLINEGLVSRHIVLVTLPP